MDVDIKSLPDDATLPKDTVLSLVNEIEVKYQEKIHHLEEQLRLFKNELFGHSSEKRHEPHANQLPLFNGDDEHAAASQASDDTIVIAAHARKKRGRRPLPKDLPRIDIVHDLSEDEKQCACGARLSRFGEEVSEKLDYITRGCESNAIFAINMPAKTAKALKMTARLSESRRCRCN